MKITLTPGHIALLKHGQDVFAAIRDSTYATPSLEKAVAEHFSCECTLTNPKDFNQPIDYEEHYTFRLYNSADGTDDDYVDVVLTTAPTY